MNKRKSALKSMEPGLRAVAQRMDNARDNMNEYEFDENGERA